MALFGVRAGFVAPGLCARCRRTTTVSKSARGAQARRPARMKFVPVGDGSTEVEVADDGFESSRFGGSRLGDSRFESVGETGRRTWDTSTGFVERGRVQEGPTLAYLVEEQLEPFFSSDLGLYETWPDLELALLRSSGPVFFEDPLNMLSTPLVVAELESEMRQASRESDSGWRRWASGFLRSAADGAQTAVALGALLLGGLVALQLTQATLVFWFVASLLGFVAMSIRK